jgi:hypothetical protein
MKPIVHHSRIVSRSRHIAEGHVPDDVFELCVKSSAVAFVASLEPVLLASQCDAFGARLGARLARLTAHADST